MKIQIDHKRMNNPKWLNRMGKKVAKLYAEDQAKLKANKDIDKQVLFEFAEAMKAINATRDR